MDYLSNSNKAPKSSLASLSPSGGLAGAENAAQARRISNTEQALASLEGTSSRLDALVSELERRISPVLLPTPPSNPSGEQRPDSSPLADKMFNEERGLRLIAERIDSIISRVDL